jgi:hypothetical protein
LNAPDLKSGGRLTAARGFESHPIRHSRFQRHPAQSDSRPLSL